MKLNEKCYDLDELFTRNFHIHTSPLSHCARKEMLPQAVISEAKKAGLKEIAITNHIQAYEEEKFLSSAAALADETTAYTDGIKVYIGAEFSAFAPGEYNFRDGECPERYFRMYSHNHYANDCWTQPQDRSALGYKRHCDEILSALIRSGKADALAHPFFDRYIVREFEEYGFHFGSVTDLWTDNELGDYFTLANAFGTAWELNIRLLPDYPAFARRYFNIGREAGAVFFIGSDAHTLEDIGTAPHKDEIKKLLGV